MSKRLLGKGLVFGLLSMASVGVFADAAGGNGCGWGNMLFEGQRGVAPHFLATTTNGTSGNDGSNGSDGTPGGPGAAGPGGPAGGGGAAAGGGTAGPPGLPGEGGKGGGVIPPS